MGWGTKKSRSPNSFLAKTLSIGRRIAHSDQGQNAIEKGLAFISNRIHAKLAANPSTAKFANSAVVQNVIKNVARKTGLVAPPRPVTNVDPSRSGGTDEPVRVPSVQPNIDTARIDAAVPRSIFNANTAVNGLNAAAFKWSADAPKPLFGQQRDPEEVRRDIMISRMPFSEPGYQVNRRMDWLKYGSDKQDQAMVFSGLTQPPSGASAAPPRTNELTAYLNL